MPPRARGAFRAAVALLLAFPLMGLGIEGCPDLEHIKSCESCKPMTDRPPEPPQQLTAASGHESVVLAWKPSLSPDVIHYVVERWTDADPRKVDVAAAGAEEGPAFRLTDHPLVPGTTYHYRVRAEDRGRNVSEPSNVASAEAARLAEPEPRGVDSERHALIRQWGTSGSGDGQFSNPRGIAVAPSGDVVYVADRDNNRIQYFDTSGHFMGKWGSLGDARGDFRSPVDVAVGRDGRVYVVDGASGWVQRFGPTGSFEARWRQVGPTDGDNLVEPSGVAIERDGNVLVVESGQTSGNDVVHRFSPDGVHLASWGEFGSGEAQFAEPASVVADAQGYIYVTDNRASRVRKYLPSGQSAGVLADRGMDPGQVSSPEGIAVLPGGNLVVAEFGERLQEFTPDGASVAVFGIPRERPSDAFFVVGVAADCRSDVYVTQPFSDDRVLVFGPPMDSARVCAQPQPLSRPVVGPPALVLRGAASKFRATLTSSTFKRGKLKVGLTSFREKGVTAAGGFRGRLVGSRRALPALTHFGRGTWRTRFDVRFDGRTSKGTARGYSLATARDRRGGRVCLQFTTTFTIIDAEIGNVRGSFRTRGGTRAGAGLIASGRFGQSAAANGSVVAAGTGRAREGPARALPAQCRQLAGRR